MRLQNSSLVATFLLLCITPELPARGLSPVRFEAAESKGKTEKVEVDFGPYMTYVQKRVKSFWKAPKDEISRKITVLWEIHGDGHISQLRLAPHENDLLPNLAAERAALEAVRLSSPFRPLPNGAPKSVSIQFSFDYNVTINGKSIGILAELRDVGMRHYSQRKYLLATKVFSKLITIDGGVLPEEQSNRSSDFNWLGNCYIAQHKYLQAAECFEKAIFVRLLIPSLNKPLDSTQRNIFGFELRDDLLKTAHIYAKHGSTDQANKLYRRAIAAAQSTYGKNSYLAESFMHAYFAFLDHNHDLTDAEQIAREILNLRTEKLGSLNPDTIQTLGNLRYILQQEGKTKEEEQLFQSLIAKCEKEQGINSSDTANSLSYAAAFYVENKNYTQAENLLMRALTIREQLHCPVARQVRQSLVDVYELAGKVDEAKQLLINALSNDEKVSGSNSLPVANDLEDLATFHLSQRQYKEAIPLLTRQLSILETDKVGNDKDIRVALRKLALLLEEKKDFAQVEIYLQKSLAQHKLLTEQFTSETIAPENEPTDAFAEASPKPRRQQTSATDKWFRDTMEFDNTTLDVESLASVFLEQGKFQDAINLHKSFAIERSKDQWYLDNAQRKIADIYIKAKNYKEAEIILEDLEPKKSYQKQYWEYLSQDSFDDMYTLASVYEKKGKFARAEQIYKSLIASLCRPSRSVINTFEGIQPRPYMNVPDEQAPVLQSATNGTIGPQGEDRTIIRGVNTAGTLPPLPIIQPRKPFWYKAPDGTDRVEPVVVFADKVYLDPIEVGSPCWLMSVNSRLSPTGKLCLSNELALASLSCDLGDLSGRKGNYLLAQNYFRQAFAHLIRARHNVAHKWQGENYNIIRDSILKQYSKLPSQFKNLSYPQRMTALDIQNRQKSKQKSVQHSRVII